MGSIRNTFSLLLNQTKNIRSVQTWTRNNGNHKRNVLSAVGLTVGCAVVMWETLRKRLDDKSASCQAVVQETKDLSPPKIEQKISLDEAIQKGQEILKRVKNETGAPGISIAVSVDGKTVWSQGFGYSDLEKLTPITENTVMRIASISKSITMTIVAKLLENGKLDLDLPVQHYVPDFPKKTVDGEPVEITCRHLVSHLSGIRHYEKKNEGKKGDVTTDNQVKKEFELNERFATITEALKLFKDDELFFKPGDKYLYTTHGYTLLSAVVEKVLNEPFTKTVAKLFKDFGMNDSYLDRNAPIIQNRGCYYVISKSGRIENAPNVDNSFKWTGGGFISTTLDLLKFANIMLYSYQHSEGCPGIPGYLKQSTVSKLWTMVEKTESYGMGWVVEKPGQIFGEGPLRPLYASHPGGAVGASSIVYILPRKAEKCTGPSGVVVAVIANLDNVGFSKSAQKIAQIFAQANQDCTRK